jgi:misacylated tRNA(Ala) deacylase
LPIGPPQAVVVLDTVCIAYAVSDRFGTLDGRVSTQDTSDGDYCMTERLFEQDAYRTTCPATVTAVSEAGIVLDQTVFYALGGGQPGDTGHLSGPGGARVEIVDTRKGEGLAIVHVPAHDDHALQVGATVQAEIDWERRHRHMRMHTCLHLLCALVDAPVTGGNLGADKGRLDFDLPESTVNKEELTRQLNELISAGSPTELQWISEAALDAKPELVKTMSVAPPRGRGQIRLLSIPGVDLQPCGGTHVLHTGEIGPVRVSKIEKKSRLNRRITVVFDE